MPFRILSLLLCLLVAGPMSTPAWALARPENRVGKIFSSPLKSTSADLDQTLDARGESQGCGYDFASGVCKYLYGADDPVNKIDPSGHFASGSSVETISVSSIITTLAATLFITGPYISAHISQREVDTIQSDFEKIQQECQLFQCDEFVVRAVEALKKRRKREPLDWAIIYYKSNSPYHEGHYSLDIYADQGFGRYGGLRISESGFHVGIILRTRTEVMRELVSDNNVLMVSKPAWITGYLVHHPDPISFITIKQADRIGVGEIGEITFSTFLSLFR